MALKNSTEDILRNYKDELKYALKLKSKGISEVGSQVAGHKLSKGRSSVPIDEYIKMWEYGIKEMESGADPEKFTY